MLLIYGAGGYTARLILGELARRGVACVRAGRDVAALPPGDGERRGFALDDAPALATGLAGITVVLNAAGPFTRTSVPLARACIARGIHYLDLAGEVDEHVALRAADAEARAAGAMVLPGVGFGCVPTEVAAVEVTRRLGGRPDRLVLAYETVGPASRGTLESVLRGIHLPGVQRRGGSLVATRPGAARRQLDLGGGRTLVVTNPWRADLIAAFASTGAPDIETLATFPAAARLLMRWPRLTRSWLGRAIVNRAIAAAPRDPADGERAGQTRVLAQAFAGDRVVEVRLRGPEAYHFTAVTAAELAQRALTGAAHPGVATPSMLLGWSALLGLPGVAEVAA